MTKARDLADLIAAGNPLADGVISVAEVSGAAPLASPTLTGTVTMGGTTYPNSDGTEGQVLTTDGSGAVSFADPAGGGSADFVASGAIANGDVVSLNSNGTVSVVQGQSQSISTPVVNNSGDSQWTKAVFDSNSNKVVVMYKDGTNSNYGTAAVGTVSGTNISFGSPVVFLSGALSYPSAVFDSNSNKVVISYRDGGNSGYGTAIVGTVSGTSISFGTAVVFEADNTLYVSSVFDSNSNKVVISYRDNGNSAYGTAIVGTVSGTSISFGSPTVFMNNGAIWKVTATFDSNLNKVIIAYSDIANSQRGTAIVGTVSGTSISFGTAVVFETTTSDYISATYDVNASKVVIAYRDVDNSGHGTAIVGTVSGTSISFGTAVVFEAASTLDVSAFFDSNFNKIFIAYRDNGNSNYLTAIYGTVNGTSINFDTASVLVNNSSNSMSAVFDSNSNKVVIAYIDASNSNSATSLVFTPFSTNALSYIGVADGAISDTATGKITINGGVNEGQSSLAVNATYYVADNGDLQTTNNGRKIGKAISATKLLVNSNMSGDEMNAYLGGLV